MSSLSSFISVMKLISCLSFPLMIFKIFYLLIWLCQVLVAACGILVASCRTFPCCADSLVVAWGLSSYGVLLSCSKACGILVPQPGFEHVSPVLQGRFLTSGQSGKSLP